MTENKLTEMENERDAQRIFSLLREERDRLEEGIQPPLPVCGLRRSKSWRLISPYWLVAASLIGFIVGIMVPTGDYADAPFDCSASADTVAYDGYSIAQNDVNTELLFTM